MTEFELNQKLQRLDCTIQLLELEAAELRMKIQFEVSKETLRLKKVNIELEYCEAAVTDRFKE